MLKDLRPAWIWFIIFQPAFTCSKLIMETLLVLVITLVSLLLTRNRFRTLLCCFHYWLWTSKCQLGWNYNSNTPTQKFLFRNFIKFTSNIYKSLNFVDVICLFKGTSKKILDFSNCATKFKNFTKSLHTKQISYLVLYKRAVYVITCVTSITCLSSFVKYRVCNNEFIQQVAPWFFKPTNPVNFFESQLEVNIYIKKSKKWTGNNQDQIY